MSDEKKFGIWEQPKNGSANGCWTCGHETIHRFETMEAAEQKARAWNTSLFYKHLHHEARQLPEAWWNLSGSEIYKLIYKS